MPYQPTLRSRDVSDGTWPLFLDETGLELITVCKVIQGQPHGKEQSQLACYHVKYNFLLPAMTTHCLLTVSVSCNSSSWYALLAGMIFICK